MTTRQLQLIFPEKKIAEKENQITSLRDRPRSSIVTWYIVGGVQMAYCSDRLLRRLVF